MNQRLALLKNTIWAEVMTFHGDFAPTESMEKVLTEEGVIGGMLEIEKILYTISIHRHQSSFKIVRQLTHVPYGIMPESLGDIHDQISEEKLKQAAILQKESDNIFEMMLIMIKMRYPYAEIAISDFRRGVKNTDKFYQDFLKAPLLELEEVPDGN